MPSSAVPRRPPPSPTVPHRPPPSSAVLHHPRPSPTVPYHNMSQIVGLVIPPNDGRPGNSRTRTDGILSSSLVPGSWQSPRRALRGPRTAENTGVKVSPGASVSLSIGKPTIVASNSVTYLSQPRLPTFPPPSFLSSLLHFPPSFPVIFRHSVAGAGRKEKKNVKLIAYLFQHRFLVFHPPSNVVISCTPVKNTEVT